MPVEEVGTVKLFKADRGYGFIAREERGQDVFVHASALRRRKVPRLLEGQRVIMDVVEGRRGPKAINIRLILAASGLQSQSDEGHVGWIDAQLG